MSGLSASEVAAVRALPGLAAARQAVSDRTLAERGGLTGKRAALLAARQRDAIAGEERLSRLKTAVEKAAGPMERAVGDFAAERARQRGAGLLADRELAQLDQLLRAGADPRCSAFQESADGIWERARQHKGPEALVVMERCRGIQLQLDELELLAAADAELETLEAELGKLSLQAGALP